MNLCSSCLCTSQRRTGERKNLLEPGEPSFIQTWIMNHFILFAQLFFCLMPVNHSVNHNHFSTFLDNVFMVGIYLCFVEESLNLFGRSFSEWLQISIWSCGLFPLCVPRVSLPPGPWTSWNCLSVKTSWSSTTTPSDCTPPSVLWATTAWPTLCARTWTKLSCCRPYRTSTCQVRRSCDHQHQSPKIGKLLVSYL